jgi:hypothetical protein
MPPFRVARFEIREDARLPAEQALHDFASRTRRDQPDATWTSFREAGTGRYLAIGTAEGFADALAPYLASDVIYTTYELVTSTDLARKHKRR